MSTLANDLLNRTAGLVDLPRSTIDGMTKRTHRIGKPNEIEEDTVPRKPRDPDNAPTIEGARDKAAARTKLKKRKYTRRAKPPEVRTTTEPTFIVDDAGRVAILDSDGTRIDLSAGATKRLTAFLEKHA